jgi:HEAT repeat protein
LRVHAGEGRTTALVTTLLFITMGAETIGESGVNALFFKEIGAGSLPTMYMLQAGIVFGAMLVLAVALPKTSPRRAYMWIPLGLAVVVGAERILLDGGPSWLYAVMWITVAVAILMQWVFLWGVAGLVTDTRQAKRLFPIFGAGAILGAVIGGLLTQPLAATIGAGNLLVVWAAGLALATVLVRAILPGDGRHGRRSRARLRRSGRARRSTLGELSEGARFVVKSRLLRAMTVAAILFSVVFYLLYLPYAQAASARFPDADELAGFFGLFWAGVTGVALVVSLVATNRILGRFGVSTTVVVLPVLYVIAFSLVAWRSTFVALVSIRFVMGVWLEAVARPAWESLTNVTPPDRRDQVRAFLNGGPTQVGTALAGVVGLVGGALASARLAVTGIVLAAVTVAVAWRIRRSYSSALVAAIRAGRPSVLGDAVPGAPIVAADGEAVSALIRAAKDSDGQVRRIAASMLPENDATRDELLRGIEDEDIFVRVSAAGALLGGPVRERALTVIEAALRDDEPGVRRHAVDTLAARALHQVVQLVPPALSDSASEVRASAIRALALAGDGSVLSIASRCLTRGDAAEEAAAVEALHRLGVTAIRPTLDVLREDPLAPAAVATLCGLETDQSTADMVRRYVMSRVASATADAAIVVMDVADDQWTALLQEAVRARARAHARAAFLGAAALGGDRAAIRSAVDALNAGEPRLVADALEVLDVEVSPEIGAAPARSLLALWETPASVRASASAEDRLVSLRADPDPLIRAVARRATPDVDRESEEEIVMRTDVTSTLERTLALRSVPLFSGLEPADLYAVAAVAEDAAFAPGEYLGVAGDLGEDLHVIVRGTVRVEHGDPPHEFARRGEGEVVGEMSVVSRSARVASLVAHSDVRTITLSRPRFESVVRERPSVGLSVMRLLADRATEATRSHEETTVHHG